jgi:hypothetical protein
VLDSRLITTAATCNAISSYRTLVQMEFRASRANPYTTPEKASRKMQKIQRPCLP